MKEKSRTRPCVTMPIVADPSVYLTGCTEKPVNAKDEEIRIRFTDSAGFIAAWMFLWVMRFMQSPRTTKTEDSRVRMIREDEFVFTSGPVTAHAKKLEGRVAIRVGVTLREHGGRTFVRELDSATCAELEKRITDMRSILNRYDSTTEVPEILEDESRWFESFDRPNTEVGPATDAPETAA